MDIQSIGDKKRIMSFCNDLPFISLFMPLVCHLKHSFSYPKSFMTCLEWQIDHLVVRLAFMVSFSVLELWTLMILTQKKAKFLWSKACETCFQGMTIFIDGFLPFMEFLNSFIFKVTNPKVSQVFFTFHGFPSVLIKWLNYDLQCMK